VIRKLFFVTAICLWASAANGQPWYRDWKVWTVIGISLGSSIAATHNAHDCRLVNGIAPCDGGYGEFRAREILRFGGSAGIVGVGLWGRHQGFKEWAIPALGFAGYNASVAFRQSRIGCPAEEHFLYGTKFTCVANQPSW
jgi:hypothetical protein